MCISEALLENAKIAAGNHSQQDVDFSAQML
jgi:hypothetical protein